MKLIEDNYSTYVLRHPDGSLIKIAKENISPDLKVKILAMADGGVVPDKGFIPIRDMPMTPPEEVVPIGVLPTTPPESKFTGVTRATKEEQMQPATFAPGTADVYKTAVDQPRPVRQAPVQPYVPEQAPGGAEEAPISPLDFPMEAASLAGAGAKGLVRGAMAGREALYKAVPRLASEVGAVGGEKVAPRINPLGMYSKLEQTIAEKMGGSATPEQIKGMLRDVKPEEMQYSGLNDFLQGKDKISKQEVLDFVKANELPVKEKVLGGEKPLETVGYKVKFEWSEDGKPGFLAPTYKTKEEAEEALRFASKSHGEDNKNWQITEVKAKPIQVKPETKFSQYTLPGGENYREKLYTLPTENKQLEKQWEFLDRKSSEVASKLNSPALRSVITGEEREKLKIESDNLYAQMQKVSEKINSLKKGAYQSSHWDEPNVLAHTRLNDRIDDEGKKHLFVEEMQSDWHQAGRKKGYGSESNENWVATPTKMIPNSYNITTETGSSLGTWTGNSPQEAIKKAWESGKRGGVPDAPMKKTWHEFVSKNLLNDAAKGGYDNISWTTGAQQAERYSLDKSFSKIQVTDIAKSKAKHPTGGTTGYYLNAYDKDDMAIVDKWLPNESALEDAIGKEAAEKILKPEFETKKYQYYKVHELSGLDLKIEQKGMRGFYDKMIPDYMAKIGKKYGVKPEKTNISNVKKPSGPLPVEVRNELKKLDNLGFDSAGQAAYSIYENKNWKSAYAVDEKTPEIDKWLKNSTQEQVWTMKITPEMRKDILEKGLPLYSVGGAVAGGMLGNNEAEAKDMNYKLLENNKDHYVMRHPDGSSFKVAKKGLNPEIMKKIEGYADFVQRAEGQIPGVDMPEQTASTMPEQPKEPDFAQMVQESPKTQQDIYKEKIGQATGDIYRGLESTYGARLGMIPEEYTPEKIRTMAEERVLGTSEREALKAKNQEFLNKEEEQQKLNETLAYNQRAAKVGMPLRPLPGQKQELPLEAQSKQMAQPEQLQPQPQVVPAADPFALYEKGIRGESAAKAEFAKQEAETYKKLQEDVTNGNKVFNDKLAKGYENLDAFQKHLQTKEVDPNRYWSNAGVANKISASIALILGGIGGALTKTDNAALKIIDKTIDNDIEAQKKNIDQGNNLYKMNLERLKDDKEAYAMTKAQMIQLAELQLKQQLSRASSKEAIAQGEINLGKLQLAKQEYLKQTALDTVIKQAQTNPQLLTPEIIQRLPEKDRELVVPGYGFAISKAGAEKIRTELLPQKDTSVQMIDDLINIRKKYGREITDREVVARAKALKTFIDGNMRLFVVGPGAVTPDERKIIDNVIADPTKVLSTDAGTIASLTGLKEGIERSFNNQAKANGLLVPQAQAQGQQPVRGADGKFYIQQGRYMIPVNK